MVKIPSPYFFAFILMFLLATGGEAQSPAPAQHPRWPQVELPVTQVYCFEPFIIRIISPQPLVQLTWQTGRQPRIERQEDLVRMEAEQKLYIRELTCLLPRPQQWRSSLAVRDKAGNTNVHALHLQVLPLPFQPASWPVTVRGIIPHHFVGERRIIQVELQLPYSLKLNEDELQQRRNIQLNFSAPAKSSPLRFTPLADEAGRFFSITTDPQHRWRKVSCKIQTDFIATSLTPISVKGTIRLPVVIEEDTSDPFLNMWKQTTRRIVHASIPLTTSPFTILSIDPGPPESDLGLVGDLHVRWELPSQKEVTGPFTINLLCSGIADWQRLRIPVLHIHGGKGYKPVIAPLAAHRGIRLTWIIDPIAGARNISINAQAGYFSTRQGKRVQVKLNFTLPITLASQTTAAVYPDIPFYAIAIALLAHPQTTRLILGFCLICLLIRYGWRRWSKSEWIANLKKFNDRFHHLLQQPDHDRNWFLALAELSSEWFKISKHPECQQDGTPTPSLLLETWLRLRRDFRLQPENSPLPHIPPEVNQQLQQWQRRLTRHLKFIKLQEHLLITFTLFLIASYTIPTGQLVQRAATTPSTPLTETSMEIATPAKTSHPFVEAITDNASDWWYLARLYTARENTKHAALAYWHAVQRLPWCFRLRSEATACWKKLVTPTPIQRGIFSWFTPHAWLNLNLIAVLLLLLPLSSRADRSSLRFQPRVLAVGCIILVAGITLSRQSSFASLLAEPVPQAQVVELFPSASSVPVKLQKTITPGTIIHQITIDNTSYSRIMTEDGKLWWSNSYPTSAIDTPFPE